MDAAEEGAGGGTWQEPGQCEPLWVRRAARRRCEDQDFAARLDDLDRKLAEQLKGAAP